MDNGSDTTVSESSSGEAAPEVKKARTHYLDVGLPILLGLALTAELFVLPPLFLGLRDHREHGQLCRPVLPPKSPPNPSAACNAWRHHQIIDYAWFASAIALASLILIVLFVLLDKRAGRRARRSGT
jgi:hypothetical protein